MNERERERERESEREREREREREEHGRIAQQIGSGENLFHARNVLLARVAQSTALFPLRGYAEPSADVVLPCLCMSSVCLSECNLHAHVAHADGEPSGTYALASWCLFVCLSVLLKVSK